LLVNPDTHMFVTKVELSAAPEAPWSRDPTEAQMHSLTMWVG